jgi:DNA-binding GntR family transcriptional regulator
MRKDNMRPKMTFKASGNLAEQITRYLSDKIIRSELAPGERILETKVAEEMGVSRGPIREALRILEKKRLVELIPRRGAKVTEMSVMVFNWLYDILAELYALVARKVADNCCEEDLRRIRAALKNIEDCAEKGDVAGYYNAIFQYAAIGQQAAGNPLLNQILNDLEPITRRIQFASLSLRVEDLRKNVVFFKLATQYIEKGDGEMAAQTIRNYAQNEREFALQYGMKWAVDQGKAVVQHDRVA